MWDNLCMKIIIASGALIIIVLSVAYFTLEPKHAVAPAEVITDTTETTPVDEPTTEPIDDGRIANPDQDEPTTPPAPVGKLKVANFTGTLESVDTGCFADGECFVVVDGKHITTTMGWSRDTVGSIIGAPSIGDLESYIGSPVEVYAKDNMDGTYTLYGSEGFYVKVTN